MGRVTAARGRARLAWLSGGAIAMGIGIWAIAPLGDVDLPFACARRVRLADNSGSAHCGNRRVCGGAVCGEPPENGSRRGLDRQRIYGRGHRRPALPRHGRNEITCHHSVFSPSDDVFYLAGNPNFLELRYRWHSIRERRRNGLFREGLAPPL